MDDKNLLVVFKGTSSKGKADMLILRSAGPLSWLRISYECLIFMWITITFAVDDNESTAYSY